MRILIVLAASLWIIGLVAPVSALHTHSVTAPYTGGGGWDIDDYPSTGIVLCGTEAIDPSLGCLGGAFAPSEHFDAGDFGAGYTDAVAVATDQAFGNQVSIWLCIQAEGDDNTCDNENDVIVQNCGLGAIAVDSGGAFTAIAAVMFIDLLGVDTTTTSVCLTSTGSVSVTFANT